VFAGGSADSVFGEEADAVTAGLVPFYFNNI
jgi:hypothetical protein